MAQAKKKKKTAKSRNLVLSSSTSIFPLFSRGCLFPPAIELSDEYEFPKPHATKFIIHKDRIPSSLMVDYAKVIRNFVPIAIELQIPARKGKKAGDDLALSQISIPLKQVKQLVFQNEDELKVFKAAEFSDVKVSSINMEMSVEENIFKDAGKTANLFESAPDEEVDIGELRKLIKMSDSYGGFLCALLYSLPSDQKWLEFIVDWLNSNQIKDLEREYNWFQSILQVISPKTDWQSDDPECNILAIASKIIFQTDSHLGWPAKQLESSISDGLHEHFKKIGSEKVLDDIKNWSMKTKRILDNEETLPQLNDDKSIALRSILLLLVRENSANLLNQMENTSNPQAGENVLKIAFMIASLREGLRALPVKIKSVANQTETRALLEFLGESVAVRSEQHISDSLAPKFDLKVEEPVEDGPQILALAYKGTRILTRKVESNPIIQKIWEICTDFGYGVESVGQDRIEVSGGKDKPLKSKVRVSMTTLKHEAKNLIRFESVAIALKTNPKVKKADAESIFGSKFTKNDLIELLVSNSTDQFGFVALNSELPAITVIFDIISDSVEQENVIDIISRLSERAANLAERQKKSKK